MRRLLLILACVCVPLSAALVVSPVGAQSTIGPAPGVGAPVVVTPGSASQVLAVDGSAAAPSMAFASQPTLGWYKSATNVLALASAPTLPAELNISGGNGGSVSIVKALTELTTIAAAATTNTAIQIPVNAVVLAVSVRVVTIIPTAATFTVTSATPTKTWNTAAVTVAAGSTDPGTLGAPSFQTTASPITITPNLTPGAATGQVRVTIFYYAVTPPTS